MTDFIKGRTTMTSRIEEVKSLEPPTVTICFYPPYKPSEPNSLAIIDPLNTPFEDRINSMSYKLGQDLSINLTLITSYVNKSLVPLAYKTNVASDLSSKLLT